MILAASFLRYHAKKNIDRHRQTAVNTPPPRLSLAWVILDVLTALRSFVLRSATLRSVWPDEKTAADLCAAWRTPLPLTRSGLRRLSVPVVRRSGSRSLPGQDPAWRPLPGAVSLRRRASVPRVRPNALVCS